MKSNFASKMLLPVITAVVAMNFTACTKESEPIITPATPVVSSNQNNLPHGVTNINYSVQVVPLGTTASGKSAGLLGATVTIQFNGSQTKTVTVDQSGIAVFSNVSPGQISGYVKAAGFSAINYTATLSSSNTVDINHTDYATSTIYLLKENSSVSGRIFGDYDLDGNVNVNQATNFQAVNLRVAYDLSSYPVGSGSGALTSVSMDTTIYKVTSDIGGNFTFNNIPTTLQGVTAKLSMAQIKKTNSSGGTVVFDLAPFAVKLNPEETTLVGDKQAF